MNVLSLFTGAGGLDLGLEAAGFEVAGCVEHDEAAQRTIRQNTDWPLADPGDITVVPPQRLLAGFGLRPGDLKVLAGGPPCQPFSKAAQWRNGSTAKMADPRAVTLRKYFEVLEAARPEVMVLENVKGLIAAPKPGKVEEHALDVLRQALSDINARHGTSYVPSVLNLEAADYGVPQKRARIFVVAHRDGRILEAPAPTHGRKAKAIDPSSPRLSNAWDAIGDLDGEGWDETLNPTGRWAALLPTIPEGRNYLWHTDRQDGQPLFGWRRKYWSFLLKLAKDKPSWTLQASPGPATGPFHWRSRRLSVREMARLQTFPDSHQFAGGYHAARKQIGNAVPVAIGELLGLTIRRELLGESDVRASLRHIPHHRDDIPPAEPVAEVPEEYLDLRGHQDPHPGAGLGPGALARTSSEVS